MGRVLLLIGLALATILIVDSAMHDPNFSPVVRRLVDRVDSRLSGAAIALTSGDTTDTCIEKNLNWQTAEIDFDDQPMGVGRVYNATDDGLAILVVVTDVNLSGRATLLTLSTSLSVTGVIIQTAERSTFVKVVPPATNVERLGDPDGKAIERISICYLGEGDAASPSPVADPTESLASTAIPTSTPPATATSGPTNSPTASPFDTATSIPSPSATSTPAATTTATHTPTATPIPVPSTTPTRTPEPTATATQLPTATATQLPTSTRTAIPTATATDPPTSTPTPEPTSTGTDTPVPTATSTDTPVPTATRTETPVPTPTSSSTVAPTAAATETPVPTATNTAVPSPTPSPTGTATPTETPRPTATETRTPTTTATETPPPTATATATETVTPTPLPTVTATSTPSPEPTTTPSPEPTVTATHTSTATAIDTPTATVISTATASPIPTSTVPASPTPEPTSTATVEPTGTATSTATALPAATDTRTATVTISPAETATSTVVPTATRTEPAATEPATATSTVTIMATVTPPVPAPTATPDVSAIYAISEGGDFSTWNVAEDWSTADGLRSSGEGDGGWALPPVTMTGISDYAVEIDVTIGEADECPRNFGVAIRGSDAGYYAAGIEWDCEAMAMIWAGQARLETESIEFGPSPHVLRIEAVGDRIAFLVDGRLVLETTDSTYPNGAEIGIWSNGVPLTITGVRVFDLTTPANGR